MGKTSPAKYIRTLERRRNRLAERVGQNANPRADDWDRMEHAALEWALPILKERSPAFGGQPGPVTLRRLEDEDTEPEGACPTDPDGLHHAGCGC